MNRTAGAIREASRAASGTDNVEYTISGLEVEMLTRVVGVDDELRVAFDGDPAQFSRVRFSLEPLAQDVNVSTPAVTVQWTLQEQELQAFVTIAGSGGNGAGIRVELYLNEALDTGPVATATTSDQGEAILRMSTSTLGDVQSLQRLTVRVPDFSLIVDQQLLLLSSPLR